MKKIIFILCFMLSCAFASDKIHVEALQSFNSDNPSESFKAKVIEDSQINDTPIYKGDIINCKLEKIKDPKRGKRDAKAYFKISSFETKEGLKEISEPLEAKYAKTIISKEKVKQIPPKKVVKTAAGAIGSYFVKGFSYGLSFADGVVENSEGNRLKSGAKQLYDDSFLSYVEKGNDIVINKGDKFYFIVKSAKENNSEDETEIKSIQKENNDVNENEKTNNNDTF